MGRGAAILPDNGIVQRDSGFAIPEEGRFALVGDTDGSNLIRSDRCAGNCFRRHPDLGRPDLLAVMFDPPGLGEDLAKFALRDAAHRPGLVEDHGP